ncbi:Hsp33 family molecular chaperone HslO [Methylomicrobium sp. Wu6]|uniref:Hsp33 family molecular chaperone HslO n=1 Tax=Methylomicrobium sp. Wu6 TaxID=3107928 RepID=UPI002DD659B2|nr:Hsp33 family molecular chaperone HslO [Methylomicrobium sp. Wu6]MEC4749920.1 Hsp33 family molecular chaperone HslO [Methylomicrobium sp. Wu6]
MEEDSLRRFIFEEFGVRGEWVKLTDSWQSARQNQHGNMTVLENLGQALAAAALLSATIKFNGSIIMQAQGDGAFRTLVAQSTHDRKIRGQVRCAGEVEQGPLEAMFGQGRLVLTIRPDNSDPYQGIVPLKGDNLAAALQTYFIQSEQLDTRLWLFANDKVAAGLLLQELPTHKDFKFAWERIVTLADTLTKTELLNLDCEALLHRLFHEEKVRLFDTEPVQFECACSTQKIEYALRSLGEQELEHILEEKGAVEVGCEFCNKQYRFDRIDVQKLLTGDLSPYQADTRH